MKLKITKLPGSKSVNVGVDNGMCMPMKENEQIIDVKKSFVICDNPLNICRCIATIEILDDLRCCGNCKNKDVNDGGILQCIFKENLSDYNGATYPGNVCSQWEFDGMTKEERKED